MKRGVGVPLLGAGVLIVVLGGGVLGQAPAGPDAAALFTEVRRQVEEVLGYPVQGQPQVVAATAETRRRWPDAELAAQLRCQFATTRREEMSQAFDLADDALLSATGAAHRPGQDVLLTRFDDALRRRVESQAPPGVQPAAFWGDYVRLV
ncbi:MAG TPA: hypothetical protein VFA26_00205, partial [Gemmataceae bacterium]|nr:hypothetical protein [Gemmataceae bacterium]